MPCWDTGAAFVFERNRGGAEGWGEVARLLPTDEPEYSLFGLSVAIDGDRVIVEAPETLVDDEDYGLELPISLAVFLDVTHGRIDRSFPVSSTRSPCPKPWCSRLQMGPHLVGPSGCPEKEPCTGPG